MKKQAGFTLIELVIVIIILGILAVTAAPKFLNLQDDAKQAAAQGVQAAVASSAQLVYSKSAMEGEESSPSGAVASSDGATIQTVFGYPKASDDGIKLAVTIDGSWQGSTAGSGKYQFKADNDLAPGGSCVLYSEAKSGAAATTILGELLSENGVCQATNP